jgi:hypothetical protein
MNRKKNLYYIAKYISNAFKYSNKKIDLRFLEVWTGKCCSLRCADCMHMIPYIKPVVFDIDSLICDIGTITQFCKIGYFSIVGGEPLTNTELYKLVDYVGQNPDITFCKLLTNGTILPSQRLMDSMKAAGKKLIVHVDQYPGTEETSEKTYQKIVSAGIGCIIFRHSVFQEMHWKYLGGIDQKKLPEDMSQDIYRSCVLRGCYTLADGEFTACPRGITTEEIYGVPKNKWENINIRQLPNNLWGRAMLATSIDQGIYKDFCRHCLGITELNPFTINAGVQLEPSPISHE